MLLCYVDGLLLRSSTKLAEEKVVSVISGIVPTKTTSQILSALSKVGAGSNLLEGSLKDFLMKIAFTCRSVLRILIYHVPGLPDHKRLSKRSRHFNPFRKDG